MCIVLLTLQIEEGISMFEAAKENRCNEYTPWSYNLHAGGSVAKVNLM